MRNAGRLKLGFYPLPVAEAKRLRGYLLFPPGRVTAMDPCVGDGVAFASLLEGQEAERHGIELDGNRAHQAGELGISVWHADALEMRCAVDSISVLYLNPPYDFEVGPSGGNKRMEYVFLKHSCRWVKPSGVLAFVIPHARIKECARTLAEHFTAIQAYRLTEPESVRFNQIAVLATRRRREDRLTDAELGQLARQVEAFAGQRDLPPLSEAPQTKYQVPPSGPVALKHEGIPLDQVEDLLLKSSGYRQMSLSLLHQCEDVRGKPITPLHGGHVGLLCTSGLLNGVFGEGDERHIARWQSTKYVEHWEEEDEDGGKTIHDCERFTQELTLLYATGQTEILTHEKKKPSC